MNEHLTKIDADLFLLKWMVALTIALNAAILIKLWVHG
jgi:hypothetical protein